MATTVIMPKFGMAQEDGTVIRWLKAEGEHVEKGETLLEVQTDKVDMEVEAPATGILHDIRVTADATVPVTTVIAMILDPGEIAQPRTGPQPQAPASPAKRLEPKASPLAQRVAVDQGVDLAAVTGTGPSGRITRADVEQQLQRKPATTVQPLPAVRATPAARRLAREAALDLSAVQGSGPQSRVQAADVEAYLAQQLAAVPSTAPAAVLPAGQTDASTSAQPPAIQLRGARRTIAQRLAQSWQSAPHIFLSTTVDMTQAEALRDRLQHDAALGGARLTLTVLLAKAVAAALARHPRLNAWLRSEGDALFLTEQPQVDLGIAVAVADGLIVPVVRNAKALGLAGLAQQIDELARKARAGALTPDDVAAGTFTISNLGMFPVDHFTAIINPPQIAILAVGRTQIQPVWDGAAFLPRPVLELTLSADHRAVDGAIGAAFLGEVKRLLEDPGRILL